MRLVTVLSGRYCQVLPKLIANPDSAGERQLLIDNAEASSKLLDSFEGDVSLSGHNGFSEFVSGFDSTFGFALDSKVVKSDGLARHSVQFRGNPKIDSMPLADK